MSSRPGSDGPGHWEGRVRAGRRGWGWGARLQGAGSVVSRLQAPTLPPSVPLSWAGTLNERSSCLLLDLLAVKKRTGMSQTEEIRCHPGLGSGCAVKEKGLEWRIAKSTLLTKGQGRGHRVSAATFQVGIGGCQADSPSLDSRTNGTLMGVSHVDMVHTIPQPMLCVICLPILTASLRGGRSHCPILQMRRLMSLYPPSCYL